MVFALQEWTSQAFPGNKSTTKFQLSDHRKCQQYWDDKWLSRDLQSNAKLKMYKDVRTYLNITSHLDMDLQKYSHGKKNKIDHPSSPSPSHPSSPSSSHSSSSPSHPSSSTPSINYSSTPISLLSNPASSQESQYSTILPQTLEEDYPIDENSVNKTPIVLCQPCVEEESSIDSQIIDNIVRFLSNDNKKGGPNSYINKVTKNAVLTACLFTQSTGLEKIRKRLSINKDYF